MVILSKYAIAFLLFVFILIRSAYADNRMFMIDAGPGLDIQGLHGFDRSPAARVGLAWPLQSWLNLETGILGT